MLSLISMSMVVDMLIPRCLSNKCLEESFVLYVVGMPRWPLSFTSHVCPFYSGAGGTKYLFIALSNVDFLRICYTSLG